MLKKIIIGVLLVTVVGAGASAVTYQLTKQGDPVSAASLEPLAANVSHTTSANTVNAETSASAGIQSASAVAEEPWDASGTITAVDDFGFDFETDTGESMYVELGPPDYWQSQGVSLAAGQQVDVTGSTMDGMYHAYSLQIADGQSLQVRTENGQPLWSGGATNGQGQNAGQADGERSPDPQAQVDEWVTVDGELLSFQGGSMTMATSDGQILTFQTGQPRFFADQGITFQVGEHISVLGFYEGEQFSAGEITQISTGLRVMLRDPNGRPLWAGPGSGNGSSGQSGGQGGSQGGNQGGSGYHGGN